MEVLQSRTDSFKAKRVQNPAKPSSTVSVKWPHPRRFIASPAVLAEAGFYFNPSYEDRDSVTCFYCEKQLSHWEVEDDPFDIHWEKCRTTCCWAIVRCGLRGDMDSRRRFISSDKSRLPTSKNMEQARFGTFQVGNGWIHDQVEDHGANSRKMARAGFVWTPQYENDDLATCLYCEVSLGGWDAKDDPMEEHKKRGTKAGQQCAFLATSELSVAGNKPASRSQSSTKPPSKPTHAKSKFQDMVLPTKTHDGELEDDSEDATPTVASSSKRPTRGRSTSNSTRSTSGSTRSTKSTTTVGKTPKKHTRSRSRGGLKDVSEDTEDVDKERDDEPPTSKTRRPTTAKGSRSRSKSVSRTIPGAFTEDEEEEEEEIVEKKAVKGRPKVVEEAYIEGDGEVEEVKILKKSTRGRPKTKVEDIKEEEIANLKKSTRGRAKNKVVSTESDEEGEVVKTSRQPSRTKSKAKPDPEPEPEEILEDDLEGIIKPPSKTRSKTNAPVARKPSRSKPKPPIVEEVEDVDDDLPTSTIPANSKKTRTASSSTKPKGRSVSKSKAPPVEIESVVSDDAAGEPDEMDVFVSPLPSPPLQPPSPLPVPSHRQEDMEQKGSSEPEELSPLVIPKRNLKGKGKDISIDKQGEQDNRDDSQSTAPKVKGIRRDDDEVLSMDTVKEGSEETHEPQRPKNPPPKAKLSSEIPPKDKMSIGNVKNQKTKKPGTERKGITVVEISTDEEDGDDMEDRARPEKSTVNRNAEIPEPRREEKDPPVQAPTQRPEPGSPPVHPMTKPIIQEPGDVEMTDVEDEPHQDPEDLPRTPPRQRTDDVSSQSEAPAPALIFPPLSKLPFTPLQSLSEAELDMTVEEWIRYQMEVEYDKFRRDGERELGRFKQKAEEVRGIIEAL